MSLWNCTACTTPYSSDLDACPHCGSTEYVEDGVRVSRKFPAFVSVSCDGCGRGPWSLRLPVMMSGLIQLPHLVCASCGSQVQVPWPPVEEDMSPKITVNGGATNAREQAESSPDAIASQPLVGAEADQGRPTPAEEPVVEDAVPEPEVEVDPYAGKTLAELREEADARGVASYGSKAQIAERLRADDEAAKEDTE